jgi:hypothetical protein
LAQQMPFLQNPELAALGGIVDPTKVVLCLAGEQRRAANHDRVMVAENDKTSSRMLNGGMPRRVSE